MRLTRGSQPTHSRLRSEVITLCIVTHARIPGFLACSLVFVGALACNGASPSPRDQPQSGSEAKPSSTAPAGPAAPEHQREDPTMSAAVDRAVSEVYGEGGWGMANLSPDALVQFVSIHRHEDHLVYVTHGVAETKPAHEFVLRIRHPAAKSSEDKLIEVAPMWPVSLLAEIAETEKRLGKPFPFGDSLGGVVLEGVELPYRNIVFMKDSVLHPFTFEQSRVVFVQTVLFDDADYAEMDAIEPGQTNTVLKDRMVGDPLGLVDG
jgi:hypothetical protein